MVATLGAVQSQCQDEGEERHRRRADQGCGGGAALGQGAGSKLCGVGEGRPRGADPKRGGKDEAGQRAPAAREPQPIALPLSHRL